MRESFDKVKILADWLHTLAVIMSGRHSRKRCIGPECHRYCCFRYASYDSGSSHKTWIVMLINKSFHTHMRLIWLIQEDELSKCTLTSFRKMNFHPFRCARTAISISSTVVLSSQPPEPSKAWILHTPAVPLKPKKFKKTPLTCCSTSKWKHRLIF